MDLQTQILSLSVLGAAAFTVLGLAIGRLRAGGSKPTQPLPLPAPTPDPRIPELVARLEDSEARCAALHGEAASRAAAESRVAECDRTIAALREEIGELGARRDAHAAERDALRAELRRSQAEVQRANIALRARTEHSAQAERTTSSELEALRRQLETARSAASKLGAESQNAAAERARLQKELAETQRDNRSSAAEIAKLRAELATSNSAAALAAELENRLAHARIAVDGAHGQIKELETARQGEAARARDAESRCEIALAVAREHESNAGALQQTVERLTGELSRRNAELAREQTLSASAQAERDATKGSALEARARIDALEARLAEADAEKAAQRADLAKLRDENLALATNAADRQRVESAHADAEKELLEARAEARGVALRLQAAEAKSAEALELRNQIDALRGQLRDLEGASVPRQELEALKKKHRDLLVRAQMMDQRIQELKETANENATLRERLQQDEAAVARARALEQRVSELEARLFAAQLRDADDGAAPAVEIIATEPLQTVGATIERMLGEFLHRGKYEVAVLGDTNGFMIAASGNPTHQENLAAVAGLADELSQRSRGLLPLGALRLIEITDCNGVSLRTRFFRVDDQALALTTLGPVAGAADTVSAAAISSVSNLLGAHAPLPAAPQ